MSISYLIHYGSLLQNVTNIFATCDSHFITKCDKSLSQNVSGFLLQNATFIANCDSTVYFRRF